MMKHAARVVVVVVSFAWVAAVLAQAPAGPPQPGPEHKRLGALVGTWKDEGDMKPSAFGPAGKFTSTETCEWYAGGFFVVCHADYAGSMGEGKGLSIYGYNKADKLYTYYAINSLGDTESAKGTVQGDTWTWHGESKIDGKLIQGQFVYKELSPDSAAMKYEVSVDGGAMNLVMEAKRTRAK